SFPVPNMSRNHIIKLYYDIISPYSFIGFETLLRYRVVWPIDIVLKPICLGGLFKDVGNPPPVTTCEAKATYMAKEVQMIARHFGIPMNVPKNFEKFVLTASTVDACRLILATQKLKPEKMEEVSRQLFDRFWIDNLPVKSEEDLLSCLKKAQIHDPNELMLMIKSANVKELLRSNTKEAEALGAFGLPWIEVNRADGGKEIYFGSDRLPIIGEFIGQAYHGPLRHLSLF
ncbi:hypothetical protein PENTCL1PPCAC_4800, partial [Pristionchus entomophagus]